MDSDTQDGPTATHPSQIPTVPIPPGTPFSRPSKDSQTRRLMIAYRREAARLVRFKAELREMGIEVDGVPEADR